MRRTLVAFVLIAGVLSAGCSQDSHSPTVPAGQALVVSPADGATGVRLDAPVKLTFAAPLDRAVIEGGLHLISERAMNDSTCPESTSMVHGSMMDWMADTTLMNHMDRYHSTPGRYAWNAAGTECVFQPDSMMTPVTRYMIHMDRAMMDMVAGQAGGGMMPGHGTGMMADDVMLHFTTMDTTDAHARHP